MSKKNRRQKLNLRPKEDQQTAPESPEPKTQKAVRELAHQLFDEKGGQAIEAAIKRMERLLELHDREAEKLLTSEVTNHRWQVSPSMVIRLQREVEREEERRQALREECWVMARQMVLRWVQDQKASPEQDAAAKSEWPEHSAAPRPVMVKGNPPAGAKGSDADAFSRAG